MNAIIFPGQGTQFQGMGKTLYDSFSVSRKVFDTMDEVLGYKLSEKCFSGSDVELKDTALQQLAILAVSLAGYEAVKDKLADIKYLSGLSLGEYSCLYAGGVLSLSDLTILVRERGEAMQKAALELSSGMVALIGADINDVKSAGKEFNFYLSNFNSPQQIVISTFKDNMDKVVEYFSSKNIKAIKLEVSGGFHSPFMEPARMRLSDIVGAMNFNDSQIPIISNYTACAHTDKDDIKHNLVNQLVSPVLWNDCVLKLAEYGVTSAYEIGPGKVLKGLIRKINRDINVINVQTDEDVNSLTV